MERRLSTPGTEGRVGRALEDVLAADAAVPAVAPATPTQRRLWRQHLAWPDDPVVHVPLVLELQGELSPDLFRNACAALAERHVTFRTAFRATHSGRLLQVPRPVELDFEWLDDVDGEASAVAHVRARVSRPFELARGRVFRAGGVATGDGRQLVYLVIHHIAVDHWSLKVALRDLERLYGCSRREPGAAPASLDHAFLAFAAAQKAALASGALADQLAFWHGRLGDLDPAFTIKRDAPPPRLLSRSARILGKDFSPEDRAAIQRIATAARTTVFTLLLSVFLVLVARLRSSSRVVVGGLAVDRPEPEYEDAVGLFLNHPFFVESVSPHLPFDEFLRRVRSTTLDALENLEVPLDSVLETFRPAAGENPWPFGRLLFQLVTSEPIDEFAGLPARPLSIWSERTRRDLKVNVLAGAKRLSLEMGYSPDVFPEAEARRVLEDYVDLCRRCCAEPAAPIGRLWERIGTGG